MLRNLCELKYVMENHECRLLCGNDAPTTFLKEALFQFQRYVGAVEDAVKAQKESQQEDPAPIVEHVPEEIQ